MPSMRKNKLEILRPIDTFESAGGNLRKGERICRKNQFDDREIKTFVIDAGDPIKFHLRVGN